MRPFDDLGNVLNATYSIETDGTLLMLIMESRSGGPAGHPGRNPDYNPALRVLLERLGRLDATMLDALVDSHNTQRLGIPEEQRTIIQRPIRLAEEPDMEALRKRMGGEQAKIAQDPTATKGGNSTKRIRLVLSVPGYGPAQADRLAEILAVPASGLVAPRAILERLASATETPAAEDYARATVELDGELDRVVQAAYRAEQAYLRKPLFDATAVLGDQRRPAI